MVLRTPEQVAILAHHCCPYQCFDGNIHGLFPSPFDHQSRVVGHAPAKKDASILELDLNLIFHSTAEDITTEGPFPSRKFARWLWRGRVVI